MKKKRVIGQAILALKQGDITHEHVDAIVNAANSSLMGGGGVDGAIHRAGGPAILSECKKIVESRGRCPTGEAVITTAGNLSARFVIHTVGPVWNGGTHQEDRLLANAYHNSLALAEAERLKSIAFPSISTGAYRFPIAEAAEIALKTIVSFLKEAKSLNDVRMVLFSEQDFQAYAQALENIM